MNPALLCPDTASALRPALAARAARTEEARQLLPDTLSELHASGLFRLLQPREVGGAELPLAALVEVSAELARSCASTGWVLANLASHHWMLGMWPRVARDEVWGAQGERGDTLVAASLIFPAGRAIASSGGFRLSGHWSFASGINLCDWVMLGAIVGRDTSDEQGLWSDVEPGEYRLFLLPRGEYSVHDTWQTAGLCGTGSNEVHVANALVPAYRSLPLTQVQELLDGQACSGVASGAASRVATNSAPAAIDAALYRMPLLPSFGYIIAGVALGIAQGMLDLFVTDTAGRLTSYSGRAMTDYPAVQARVAEAAAQIDAARRILLGNCDDIMRAAAACHSPDLLEKLRLRRDAAFAARLCSEAVASLFTACGGAALFLSHPAQRALRDMHGVCAHITLNWDAAAALYGRVALGHGADLPPYER